MRRSGSGGNNKSGNISLQGSLDTFEHPLVEFMKASLRNQKNPRRAFTSSQVLTFDKNYKRVDTWDKEADSLMCLALRFKNLNGLNYLLDRGVTITQDNKEFLTLLGEVFGTKFSNTTEQNNTLIFERLQQIPNFNQKLAEVDPAELNDLFVQLAKENDIAGCLLMLKFNLVSNVNHKDTTQHTVLYYAQLGQQNADITNSDYKDDIELLAKLEAVLLERQAILSDEDKISFDQFQFLEQIKDAAVDNDAATLINLLNDLQLHPEKLSQDHFEEVLDTLVLTDQHAAMRILLENPRTNQINWSANSITSKINSGDMATILMEYAATMNITFNSEVIFDHKIKEFAHRIGLSGTIDVPFMESNRPRTKTLKLGGYNTHKALVALTKVLDEYRRTHPDFSRYFQAAEFAQNAANIHKGTAYADLMLARQKQGEIILFGSGWKEHTVGVASIYNAATDKTYLAISNRGMGALQSCLPRHLLPNRKDSVLGTAIVELPGPLSGDFFNKLGCYVGVNDTTQDHFSNTLAEHLQSAKLLTILPAGSQGHETCSYVNQKRSIEGLMWIEGFLQNKDMTTNEAKVAVFQRYKQFALTDKTMAIDDLISLYQNNKNAAHLEKELLKELIIEVFIQRGSLGIENQTLKKLYDALDKDIQEQIPAIYKSEAFFQRPVTINQVGLFTKRQREIAVTGNRDSLSANAEKIAALKAFFQANGIDSSQVKSMKITKNDLHISTASNRDVKTHIRDQVMKGQLAAKITNIDGKYEFIVNDFANLLIPSVGLKNK